MGFKWFFKDLISENFFLEPFFKGLRRLLKIKSFMELFFDQVNFLIIKIKKIKAHFLTFSVALTFQLFGRPTKP